MIDLDYNINTDASLQDGSNRLYKLPLIYFQFCLLMCIWIVCRYTFSIHDKSIYNVIAIKLRNVNHLFLCQLYQYHSTPLYVIIIILAIFQFIANIQGICN
jgi:hypothetical protein